MDIINSPGRHAKIYRSLMDKARSRCQNSLSAVRTEWHHVVPSSYGGSDGMHNLVRLTIKEHVFAHHLLFEMSGRKGPMVPAWHWMLTKHDVNVSSCLRKLANRYRGLYSYEMATHLIERGEHNFQSDADGNNQMKSRTEAGLNPAQLWFRWENPKSVHLQLEWSLIRILKPAILGRLVSYPKLANALHLPVMFCRNTAPYVDFDESVNLAHEWWSYHYRLANHESVTSALRRLQEAHCRGLTSFNVENLELPCKTYFLQT